MRTAIIHYWLLNMRGGEKVVESLCRLLPGADIFTLFYEPERISPLIRSHRVTPSFLNPLRKRYRALLPLMPLALEHFDLRGYDLVISSESGPAKGVLTSANTRHICYCHTPMRYLWELYPAYLHDWTRAAWQRAALAPVANYLRLWDVASAARVDQFLANSENVRRRIWKTYRREADIVYPPVAVETFYSKPAEDYFLIVSEFVAYKRLDYAVAAFAKSGRKLKLVGDGPEFKTLRRLAAPNVEFCGRQPEAELRDLYARCRALLMPGEEDFGITAVEALASGKPVVGLGRGGILESAPEGDANGEAGGGFFYAQPAAEDLNAALARFEAAVAAGDSGLAASRLQAWAARFSEREFLRRMSEAIAASSAAAASPPLRKF